MTIRDIAIAIGYQIDKKSEAKVNQSIQSVKNTASKILGALGIGFSLTQIHALADEFNGINDQINNATQGLGDQNEIQQKILETANETRTEYGHMGNVVSKLVQSNRELFSNVNEAAEYAELTTKFYKAAGKSNEEISSLQDTLNTAFAKGIVDTRLLNALFSQSPETLNLMAQSIGVSKDTLIQMVKDGKVKLADLKNAFLSNANTINEAFGGLDYSISDAMLHVRNEWGLFIDGFNSTFGITQMIAKGIVKVSNIAMNAMRKVQTWIERVAKAVGGVNNLIKLLAIAAGSIFIAFNFSKITSFLSSIMKLMGGINIKALAIVAVIALIALLIDDFINFMKGNNSVIGELFKKAGIDADEAREKIIGAWNKIKGFLLKVWTGIKNTGKKIWDGLKSFWAKNGDSIKQGLVKAWKAISTTLIALWETIKSVAIDVFGKLKTFWDENGEKIKTSLLEIWEKTKESLSTVWEWLKDTATSIFNGLSEFWDEWGDNIMTAFAGIWDFIGGMFYTTMDILGEFMNFISNVFSGDWEGAWENIKNIFGIVWDQIIVGGFVAIMEFFGNLISGMEGKGGEILEGVKAAFSKAIDWIKNLPKEALTWGADIISGIVDGIKAGIGKIGEAATWIGEKITSFLGFSVPEEGPLSKFPEWMPHFMQGLSQGINDNAPIVIESVKRLTADMSLLANAETVSPVTARAVTSSSVNKTIVQNNTIETTFNGSDRDLQKQGSKAMEKSADDIIVRLKNAFAYSM